MQWGRSVPEVKSEHNHLLRISTDEKKLIFLDFTPQVRKLGYTTIQQFFKEVMHLDISRGLLSKAA